MKNQPTLMITCCVSFLITLFSMSSIAQERTHKGFYLSLQSGPAFGYINGNNNSQTSIKVSGTGFSFDLQIGGAVKENLILHGTLGVKSIFGPTINNVSISKDYSFDEFMMGIGTTYYLHNNIFFTGNIGIGNFSFADESTNTTYDTGEGFSYQLKAGKEWWISPRWALGAALAYSGTRTDDTMDNGYEESWQSHRFSVHFTATLNGKK